MPRLSLAKVFALTGVAVISAASLTPAALGASGVTTQNGYYAANTRVASADVEFHVRSHGTKTTDLALVCFPRDPAWTENSGEAQIAVKAPTLTVSGGRLNFHGSAVVAPVQGKRVATETFNLSLHRVSGPTIHVTNTLGGTTTETAAWKGTATSTACKRAVNGGKVTLFGPVPGE